MYIFLIQLLFTTFWIGNSNFYEHDAFKKPQKRILQQSEMNMIEWKPIQIYFEYVNKDQEDKEIQDYIESILNISTIFFGKHLMVRDSGEILNFGEKTTCGGIEIPEQMRMTNYSYHLVIFVTYAHELNKSYLAYSGPCKITDFDYRPTFGIINWNIEQLSIQNADSFTFQRNLQTAIHEIIHTLGFIKILYDYYYDPNTLKFYNLTFEKDNYDHLILETPRLINVTRQYFQCNTAKGAYMENQGGNNTAEHHFERTIYFNEIMTGSQMNGLWIFSIFTFQLLQDTGFYRLLQYKADTMNWGRDKGCEFLEKSCEDLQKSEKYDEFCNSNGYHCSEDGYGIGKCGYDQLSDQCSYQNVVKGMFCLDKFQSQNLWQVEHFQETQGTLGQTIYPSKCFEIEQNIPQGTSETQYVKIQASCYQYNCIEDEVFVNVNEVNIKPRLLHCPNNGSITITELDIKITCQKNSTQICQDRNDCVDQCNQRGFCVNKQCKQQNQKGSCMKGYSGYSCEIKCQFYRKENKCLEQCDSQDYQDENLMYCLTCPGVKNYYKKNCLRCSKIDQCLQCESGFSLIGGFCDPYYSEVIQNQMEFILNIVYLNILIYFM